MAMKLICKKSNLRGTEANGHHLRMWQAVCGIHYPLQDGIYRVAIAVCPRLSAIYCSRFLSNCHNILQVKVALLAIIPRAIAFGSMIGIANRLNGDVIQFQKSGNVQWVERELRIETHDFLGQVFTAQVTGNAEAFVKGVQSDGIRGRRRS